MVHGTPSPPIEGDSSTRTCVSEIPGEKTTDTNDTVLVQIFATDAPVQPYTHNVCTGGDRPEIRKQNIDNQIHIDVLSEFVLERVRSGDSVSSIKKQVSSYVSVEARSTVILCELGTLVEILVTYRTRKTKWSLNCFRNQMTRLMLFCTRKSTPKSQT